MKFLKKSLSLLLVLAVLFSTVTVVSAYPGYFLSLIVNFYTPTYNMSSSRDAYTDYYLPNYEDKVFGYDFIGWTDQKVDRVEVSLELNIYEVGYVLEKAEGTYNFYALFGKVSSDPESSEYEYYSTEIVREPAPFDVGHTLALEQGISVNFLINKADLEGYDSYSFFTRLAKYEDGTIIDYDYCESTTKDVGQYICCTVTGVDATRMNDTVCLDLRLGKDGEIFFAEEAYSIATYAYSQLNKEETENSLKTLCADMLRYGSMAQLYKGYRTDALADAEMTDVHRSYLSDLDAVTFDTISGQADDLPDAPIKWVGKTLDLQSKVALRCVFDYSGYGKYYTSVYDLCLAVRYTDVYGQEQVSYSYARSSIGSGSTHYSITFEDLATVNLRVPLELQIVETSGNVPVSNTMYYSISSYGNGKTGALLTLCQALMAYSDSTRAYFS